MSSDESQGTWSCCYFIPCDLITHSITKGGRGVGRKGGEEEGYPRGSHSTWRHKGSIESKVLCAYILHSSSISICITNLHIYINIPLQFIILVNQSRYVTVESDIYCAINLCGHGGMRKKVAGVTQLNGEGGVPLGFSNATDSSEGGCVTEGTLLPPIPSHQSCYRNSLLCFMIVLLDVFIFVWTVY